MARQTHPYSGGIYRPGDEWDTCDRCGLDYYKSELIKEPFTEFEVCPQCVDEPSHFDLMRGKNGS